MAGLTCNLYSAAHGAVERPLEEPELHPRRRAERHEREDQRERPEIGGDDGRRPEPVGAIVERSNQLDVVDRRDAQGDAVEHQQEDPAVENPGVRLHFGEQLGGIEPGGIAEVEPHHPPARQTGAERIVHEQVVERVLD